LKTPEVYHPGALELADLGQALKSRVLTKFRLQ